MNTFLRYIIRKLCDAVSSNVAATRDALAERLQSVHVTASLLYNRRMQNIEYGRERLKGVEKEAQEESEGQEEDYQQVDNEQYDTVPKIRWCTKKRALNNSG